MISQSGSPASATRECLFTRKTRYFLIGFCVADKPIRCSGLALARPNVRRLMRGARRDGHPPPHEISSRISVRAVPTFSGGFGRKQQIYDSGVVNQNVRRPFDQGLRCAAVRIAGAHFGRTSMSWPFASPSNAALFPVNRFLKILSISLAHPERRE